MLIAGLTFGQRAVLDKDDADNTLDDRKKF